MIKRSKFKLILLLVFVYYYIFSLNVSAQINSSGTAFSVPISDTEVQDGDIICTYPEGNLRCNTEYDTAILGVVNSDPAVSIEDYDITSSKLILTSGIATVRVSTKNGTIKEGDLITTSSIPGVGQKASKNGYVLGMAMENYEAESTEMIGKIQLVLNIHLTGGLSASRSNLLQFIREGLSVPIFEPVESLRYILAALMVIISFTLGMIYFGRASRTGIEAVGRNPLAKKVIQLTIFLNIVLTIVIVIVGLAIAYLILIL